MDSRRLYAFETPVPLLAGDGSFFDLAVGEGEVLKIGEVNVCVGLNLAANRDRQSARRSAREVFGAEIDRDAGDADLDLRRHPDRGLHQWQAKFFDPKARGLDLVGIHRRASGWRSAPEE